ncbi:MAG: insulinase family protein [Planctomycetaceae bacterium]|nr:insulinase family protein [Planctomycetaceae bacterium]
MKTRMLLGALSAALLLAAALAPLGAQEKPAAEDQGLDVAEFTLDNGLRVLVVNRPGVPVVSSFVWYAVGAADEEPQKTGMAHFLEHMMFKGSSHYKKGDIDAITARNGGSNNAFTSNDYTAYFIDLPKSRYVEALKIEADRMRRLTLDQAEFDAEKKVVQSESDISADNPQSRLWERLDVELYGPAHPYAHPVLGWPQDIADTTRRDMRAFYDRHYHPNHATLVLCGDITEKEARPVVTELFGSIARGPEMKRPVYSPVQFKGRKSFEVRSDAEVVQMARAYMGVPAGHDDEPALDVLSMILGDGVTSRLYRHMVDETMQVNQIGAGNLTQMLGGIFYIWAELADGVERADVSAGIDGQIARLIKEGVKPSELDRAKRLVVAQDVFGREKSSDIAQQLGAAQIVQGDWRAALRYPERIKQVTVDDVLRVAKRYLGEGHHVTGWLVPKLTESATGSGAEDAKPQPLPVSRHVLENGAVVLLYARSGLPVVSASVGIRAGRATEPAGKAGLSSFGGGLLDTGTTKRDKLAIAEAIEGVGGELNVGAGGGSLRVLSEHAALGLDLLADCLINPAFKPMEIELLRKQMLAAIESGKDETSVFARDAANAWLYGPDTALGAPAQGTVASVKSITREDIVKWHKTWFRPDNAVIAVVGDFKESEMLALLRERFGAWKKPVEPLLHPRFEFKSPGSLSGTQALRFDSFDFAAVDRSKKRITIDHPEKDQVVVRLQCLGIRRDNPDYYALMVLDSVLGTSPGFTDRFSRKLRDDMGLAYSTYANIAGSSGLQEGAFLGYIGTRAENVEVAISTMYELVREIREQPVSERELRDAKDYLKGSFVFSLESTGQLADLMLSIERYQLGNDYLVRYAQAIEAVTAEDITRVARKYLVPENMVEVLCGPVSRIGQPGDSMPGGK